MSKFEFDKTKPDHSIFGWLDEPGQEVATHDPGIEHHCPICGEQLSMENVHTISFMPYDHITYEAKRSWFYRIHRTCKDPEKEAAIEAWVVGAAKFLFGSDVAPSEPNRN